MAGREGVWLVAVPEPRHVRLGTYRFNDKANLSTSIAKRAKQITMSSHSVARAAAANSTTLTERVQLYFDAISRQNSKVRPPPRFKRNKYQTNVIYIYIYIGLR